MQTHADATAVLTPWFQGTLICQAAAVLWSYSSLCSFLFTLQGHVYFTQGQNRRRCWLQDVLRLASASACVNRREFCHSSEGLLHSFFGKQPTRDDNRETTCCQHENWFQYDCLPTCEVRCVSSAKSSHPHEPQQQTTRSIRKWYSAAQPARNATPLRKQQGPSRRLSASHLQKNKKTSNKKARQFSRRGTKNSH